MTAIFKEVGSHMSYF